jgi:transcriptional regulator with XRE-family HTH domain
VRCDTESFFLLGFSDEEFLAALVMASSGAFFNKLLKALREHKKMSQCDIEKRSGLLRCYISRVENGHTVPAIETMEKMARAMEVPMYQLFYDGEKTPGAELPKISDDGWGSSGRDARTLGRFRTLLRRTSKADQKLLMFVAQKMSQNRSAQSDENHGAKF